MRLRRLAATAVKMSSLRDYTASSDERRLLIICVYLRSSVVHGFVCKLLFEYRQDSVGFIHSLFSLALYPGEAAAG